MSTELPSPDLLACLVPLTRQLRRELLHEVQDGQWDAIQSWYHQRTGCHSQSAFADSVAQAIICASYGYQTFSGALHAPRAMAWLQAGVNPLLQRVLALVSTESDDAPNRSPICAIARRATALVRKHTSPTPTTQDLDPAPRSRSAITHSEKVVYFYEHFLAAYDAENRRRKGVFYTPPELVAFVVRQIDSLLADEFGLCHGIADTTTWQAISKGNGKNVGRRDTDDTSPFVQLLDPAMGTGAFLLEAMSRARIRFDQQLAAAGLTQQQKSERWNTFVSCQLLPRIWGLELMPAPLVLAQLSAVAWLAESGFRFQRPGQLHFHLANSLLASDVIYTTHGTLPPCFTVVLGNPPFSGISDNRQRWIHQLLRGKAPDGGEPVANYFELQGKPLGERKHWLEDDYVKFMRLAHWLMERSGAGIMALVTNHGYLNNTTFRGMREKLLMTFPNVSVIDLHGSSRDVQQRPHGIADESIFGIEQGIAVGFFRRPPGTNHVARIQHAHVWGNRESKLKSLTTAQSGEIAWSDCTPQPPHFFLVPRSRKRQREYQDGYCLSDVMPVNSTAVVTARDGFVVAMDREQLVHRISEFVDPRQSDDAIRTRFFTNSRSSKYPAGDTRSWKMAAARQQLRQLSSWQDAICRCSYRPFDQRQILWLEGMIDWPRKRVMDHLLLPNNLALVARRQTPPTAEYNYFWIADAIVLDGVIRSDNRGSESIFPLFVTPPRKSEKSGKSEKLSLSEEGPLELEGQTQPNFSVPFVEEVSRRLQMPWSPAPTRTSDSRLTPRQLLDYIYALFHTPSYRRRFAEELSVDFPRVFIPRSPDLFVQMADLGTRLVDAHRLTGADQWSDLPRVTPSLTDDQLPLQVATGYPKFRDQAVWFNRATAMGPVRSEVWEFRVGTYQVCRKWLKDRCQSPLTQIDLQQYGRILSAVDQTWRIMSRLDTIVERAGGWRYAFG